MAGGESGYSDILYKDADICILHPSSKRGIEIFTISKSHKICEEGLLSYNELRRRHPEYGLTNRSTSHANARHDDLIFFRAPYNSDIRSFKSSYDNKSPEKLIETSYSQTAIATIRIDPDKSFVYYSESRSRGNKSDIYASRLPMRDYLDRAIPLIKGFGRGALANVYTKDKKLSNSLMEYSDTHGATVSRFFETVAHIPHIPPEWFVSCHKAGKVTNKGNNTTRNTRTESKKEESKPAKMKSFQAEWLLRPQYGDEVPKCPTCGAIGGSNIRHFQHRYGCPYIGIPPAPKGGGKHSRRVTKRQRKSGRDR
jgi:hypothetical protein